MTPTSLAMGASSFHGRTEELGLLRELFDQSRWVSVLGPGGMGKTRLALHYVRSARPSYEPGGGTWVVDVAAARSPGELVAAVAHSLHVSIEVGAADAEVVGAHLERRGPTLLVLDNLEHVADMAGPVLVAWLNAAPALRLLVTSRVAVGVAGEHVLNLPPLSEAASAELFISRAKAIDSRIALDSGLVAAVVRSVDRMPLAIELAASRTRILSLSELARRLERPLDVLTAGPGSGRHDSVRRAVTDSLALLDPTHRRLFAFLAVLDNGFRTEDAEAVLGGIVVPRAAVLGALDTLARSSLLQADRTGPVARHQLLHTVREVAGELAAQEADLSAVQTAHAEHFTRRAQRWVAAQQAPVRQTSEHRIRDLGASGGPELHDGDVQNMLTAHRFYCGTTGGTPLASLALALDAPLIARGHVLRRRSLLAETLARVNEPRLVCRLKLALGRAEGDAGQTREALGRFEDALARVDRRAEPVLAAEVLVALGGIDDVHGETARARERYDVALALLHDRSSRAALQAALRARLALAHAYRREGQLAQGERLARAAADTALALGDALAWTTAQYELATLAMFAQTFERADAYLVAGLEVAEERSLPVMTGAMNTARGCLHQLQGHSAAARSCHAEAARVFGDCGSRHREGSALYYLATTYLETGEPAEALPILERAQRRLAPIGSPRYEALVAAGLALAHAGCAHPEQAERLMTKAERCCEQVSDEPALPVSITLQRWALERPTLSASDLADRIRQARAWVRAQATDDTQFALRMLLSPPAAPPNNDAHALVVWPDDAVFRPPGQPDYVRLKRDSPNHRILKVLLSRRTEEPGERVTLDEIIQAGWAGEKVAAEAALNRAYVAIATLRKKGLRGFLDKVAGGYALSPALAVRIMKGDAP